MIDPESLIGVWFEATKDCCQHYSGEAIVIRQKKGGMFLCQAFTGEVFEEAKTKIVRSKMNAHREFMRSAPDNIEGFERVGE